MNRRVAVSILVGVVVVGAILFGVFTNPYKPDLPARLKPPEMPQANTVVITVKGTTGIRFNGSIGTEDERYPIEGITPARFSIIYDPFDLVIAEICKTADRRKRLEVLLVAEDRIVATAQTRDGCISPEWSPETRT